MSQSKDAQEPSMEEILASIRRIISEEGGAERDSKPTPAEPEPAAESDDDILDLTEVIAGGGAGAAEAELEDPLAAADAAEADAEAEAEPFEEPEPEPAPYVEIAEVEVEVVERFVVEADTAPELAGEEEPVNLPGVPIEGHRSWSRRMQHPLDELLRSSALERRLAPLRQRSTGPGGAD